MKRREEWIFLLLFILVMLVPGCQKSDAPGRCDYDWVKIEPLYAVDLTLQDGSEKKFCSIACALQAVTQYKEQVESILVTDETTGQKEKPEKVFFVESRVVSVPHVRNNVHAFVSEETALRHRDQYQGKMINNPFAFLDLWKEEIIGDQRVRIKFDPLSGIPRIIRGFPSVMFLKDFDPNGLTEKEAWKILATLLSHLRRWVDLDLREFKLIDVQRVENASYVAFWQTYGGIIIYESSLGFSIGEKGDIPAVGFLLHKDHRAQNVPTKAKLSLKESTSLAKAYLKKREPWEHKLLAYQLIIYPMKKDGRVNYYLTYILTFLSPEDRVVGSARVGWTCFVDAMTGEIVDTHYMLAIPNCCEFVTENES